MTDDSSNVPVNATVTAMRVLEHLYEHETAGVTAIATDLDASKSTVHNHLQTFAQRDYVEKEDGTYRLGLRFLDFAGAIQRRHVAYDSVKQRLQELADQTGEITLFVVDDGGMAVILLIEKGANAAETNIRFGKRIPSEEILAGAVIDDAKEGDLTGELGEANCRVGNEEFVRGLRSVAAPLTDMDGSLHGAASITGPVHRFRDPEYEEQIMDELLNVVNELELDVSYSRY